MVPSAVHLWPQDQIDSPTNRLCFLSFSSPPANWFHESLEGAGGGGEGVIHVSQRVVSEPKTTLGAYRVCQPTNAESMAHRLALCPKTVWDSRQNLLVVMRRADNAGMGLRPPATLKSQGALQTDRRCSVHFRQIGVAAYTSDRLALQCTVHGVAAYTLDRWVLQRTLQTDWRCSVHFRQIGVAAYASDRLALQRTFQTD